MNIQAQHSAIKASELPLESLAGNPNISESEKISEVSRQFEAVLLRQILQEARKSDSGSSGGSLSSDVYTDMINQQIADSVSRSGAFGLGKSLQGQLAHQVLHPSAPIAPHTPSSDTGAEKIITHDGKH
jgi:Rod binding domain-containing protein